jgi:hypothetical protein|tara:strand:+ start:69 stop:350 length:282 start_codon:yes stop_codon:yes gene_type:complete
MIEGFFTVGPFKDSQKRIRKFGSYLYFNTYYNKTLVKLLDLEEERSLAIIIDDIDKVEELNQKIMTYETMMLMVSSYALSESIDSPENNIIYD